MQPVFTAQSGDQREVAQVGCDEERIDDQGDRCDLEVNCADADTLAAQACELVRGTFFERRDLPIAQDGEKLAQADIGRDGKKRDAATQLVSK